MTTAASQCSTKSGTSPKRSCPINVIAVPTKFHPHIAAIGPTQVRKRLRECREAARPQRIVFVPRPEHADASHSVGLLRPRSKRRHRRAEPCDEVAPPHSRSLMLIGGAYRGPGCLGTGLSSILAATASHEPLEARRCVFLCLGGSPTPGTVSLPASPPSALAFGLKEAAHASRRCEPSGLVTPRDLRFHRDRASIRQNQRAAARFAMVVGQLRFAPNSFRWARIF